LRKAHPSGADINHKVIYDFIVHGDLDREGGAHAEVVKHLEGFERAQAATSEKELVSILRDYPNLPHEALPTELKNKPDVVMSLLENGMPIGAMIRNLATYTRAGVLEPGSNGAQIVLDALKNEEKIRKARIHPIAVLSALQVYSNGRYGQTYSYGYGYGRTTGLGKGVETPNAQIVDALDDAFYLAFGNVQPTGKRHLLALDMSGSMGQAVSGVPGISCAMGAAAMSMVTARSGDPYLICGFSTHFKELPVTAKDSLSDAMRKTNEGNMGGTDCAVPMEWAQANRKEFDAFFVYTDNETWAGRIHPSQALKAYRKAINPEARLGVIAMVANDFSIADPNDAGMIDVVGFDTATPQILSDFARGAV
jgi:60 kDa SS-A/Ro ribonucleoprotein